LAAFRKGLGETGFVEGRNVVIEYRSANNIKDRLSELAADLVSRHVNVIAASPLPAVEAAKAATDTIPIVFRTGGDPVQFGLVASLNRPGGNLTGINDFGLDLGPKRLQLLHDLLPRASRFAVLVDPTVAITESAQVLAAASSLALSVEVITASTNREIDGAFASLAEKQIEALLLTNHTLFFNRRVQLVTLAARQGLPVIAGDREFTEGGGLMSFGSDLADQFRLVGIYTGRILKGDKPSDLPVIRATKFDFVINLQTARILGIEVPPTLLAIADEVIE
jgi:putative ABC transport system substrate-binding protein